MKNKNQMIIEKINVLHLQSGLPTSGNAIFRLHEKMTENGINSTMLMLNSFKSLSSKLNTISDPFKNFRIIANNMIERFILKNQRPDTGTFSNPKFGYNLSKNELVQKADIIFIHWAIGGFLTLKGYRSLARLGKPVVVFMHDMWNITGGCHHSFDCDKYTTGCKNCPMFYNISENGIASKQFLQKQSLYNKFDNFVFVAPSKWLTECARNSGIPKTKRIYHIPNIINSNVFKPFDKKIARNLLGINSDKTIITFGAKAGTSSVYKGWPYMLDALKILRDKIPEQVFLLLIFGSEYHRETARSVPYETLFTGYLYDDYALNIVYNAADIFVTPSIADNLPSTVIESQCCGTPVVGFRTGGIPDMIEHKKNGYLAKYKNSEDLADGIIYCLQNNVTGFLNKELDPDMVIGKYKNLITELVKK